MVDLSFAFCLPLLALCIKADAKCSLKITPWKLSSLPCSNCDALRYGIVDPNWTKSSDSQQLISASAFIIGESRVHPLGF